ncbi:hypothetical protein C7N43_36045 [Sphingobacteriales bacterium UPWRP_1]|nr:hypothetical protein C7N43_36045 [Sphingobacteriales bacterium UPWRP_1]
MQRALKNYSAASLTPPFRQSYNGAQYGSEVAQPILSLLLQRYYTNSGSVAGAYAAKVNALRR